LSPETPTASSSRLAVIWLKPFWTKVVWKVTIESDASEKPCCVADWLVRYYPAP